MVVKEPVVVKETFAIAVRRASKRPSFELQNLYSAFNI